MVFNAFNNKCKVDFFNNEYYIVIKGRVMKMKSKKVLKSDSFSKEQIKENCIIEFLCLLSDKPVLSIRNLIDKLKNLFKR